MCPRTLSDRHDQTETYRALWFFSPGPQRTNLSLQTGPTEVRFRRNRDVPIEDDDCAPLGTIRVDR